MLTKDVNEAGRAADIAGDEWARPAWGRPAGWWAVVTHPPRASCTRTSIAGVVTPMLIVSCGR